MPRSSSLIRSSSSWTWCLTLLLIPLNSGLFLGSDSAAGSTANGWLVALEYDGNAIRAGEWWRLLTANLVHMSRNHFYLDVGVFVVLGCLYERPLRGIFPWLLLVTALAGSLGGLICWPRNTVCRGLSAVDSGLFAAALWVEITLALRDRARWLWVGPATLIFVLKNVYECWTGQSFFGTQSLLGPAQLAVAAHTAAILAALALLACLGWKKEWAGC